MGNSDWKSYLIEIVSNPAKVDPEIQQALNDGFWELFDEPKNQFLEFSSVRFGIWIGTLIYLFWRLS